jgi:hypothetical protein
VSPQRRRGERPPLPRWWKEQAKRWLNRRWETERGIWLADYNNSLALVRAPVDDVALAFQRRTARWDRDVLGAEVVVGEEALFLFRLRGHSWTEVLHSKDDYDWVGPVSRRLDTRAILYAVSDTACCIGYFFYGSGRRLERFEALDSGREVRFRSKIRRAIPADVEDGRDWPNRFFLEQDALEPFIDFNYFFNRQDCSPGERVLVQNPGFALMGTEPLVTTRPGLERVDYLVLR